MKQLENGKANAEASARVLARFGGEDSGRIRDPWTTDLSKFVIGWRLNFFAFSDRYRSPGP